MIETIRKLLDLLDRRDQRNGLLLVGLMLVLGIVEAAGVASIMPMMAVLLNPEFIHSNAYLAAAYETFGFTSTQSFLVALVSVVFMVMITRIAFSALTQYAIARYSQMRTFTISTRLLETYLRRPYSWFLDRHSADLGKSVLMGSDQVVSGSLLPTLNFISATVVTLCLVGLLAALQPLVAITAGLVIGGLYVLTYLLLRVRLGRLGEDRLEANKQRFQLAQEVLAGIKEVKLSGLESAYLGRFRAPAHRFASRRATHMALKEMPRYLLETIAFGAILIVALVVLTREKTSLETVLPVLAAFSLAGMRLLPAMHKLYRSSAMLRFGRPALDSLHADISAPLPKSGADIAREGQTLALRDRLELLDVTFTYPNAKRFAASNVSLTIRSKTTVGFVGSTGSGKTTLVDIILGLLEPQNGQVLVDGVPITSNNIRSWQRAIGYVPQQIFLADETVAGNIAFGVPARKIDMQAVERAARVAELHDFVKRELPQGYQTKVGEKGVRLSGGQRQRIGIARALYSDPDVLVMDEATSSLDSLTEKALMDAIHNLSHRKTILLVAHRLNTVHACDQIFFLEQGRLKTAGTYSELFESQSAFRGMVTGQLPDERRYLSSGV